MVKRIVPMHKSLINLFLTIISQSWWHMLIIIAFGKMIQEDCNELRPAWAINHVPHSQELYTDSSFKKYK